MRTTVTLDADIYEAALHLSQVSGERLGKVISDLARRGLQPSEPPTRRNSKRFPTFDVPANAPKLSLAAIRQVIDDQGLF